MSRLKTILLAGVLTLGAPLNAFGQQNLAQTFAHCVGRLSAEMEHQWLLNDANAEKTEAHRTYMIALLRAVMPPESGRWVLAQRVDAKMAHASLLTRATFNDDPEDAQWARTRADIEMSLCLGLVLS